MRTDPRCGCIPKGTLLLDFYSNEKQKDKQNEWSCMRDSSGKPGAVGNREDLKRIARPEGACPKSPTDECFQRMPAANAMRGQLALRGQMALRGQLELRGRFHREGPLDEGLRLSNNVVPIMK